MENEFAEFASIEIPMRDAEKYGVDVRPDSEADSDEEVNHG